MTIKDMDIMTGYSVVFNFKMNELFQLLSAKLQKDNAVEDYYDEEALTELLDNGRKDKIDSYIKFLEQNEAVARMFIEVGKYYESAFKNQKEYAQSEIEKYELKNPDWKENRILTESEKKHLLEVDEKYHQAKYLPLPAITYQENNQTVTAI